MTWLHTIAWLPLLASIAPTQKIAEIVRMEEDFDAITSRLGITELSKQINTQWMARSTKRHARLRRQLLTDTPVRPSSS